MNREPLVMVCTCEMAGRVRGKGFPLKDLPERLIKGVGWVPTNSMINCFGIIGDTPFGATGDLILVPDSETAVRVRYDDDSALEHFYLGDIRETDGRPWACCPRDFLRRGLAALEKEVGYRLYAAFEQEFVYTGVEELPGASYSLDAYRRQGIFGEAFTAAPVGKQLHRRLEGRARHLGQRALHIGDHGAAIAGDEVARRPRRSLIRVRCLGERGLQPQLQLVAQRLLEFGIAGKAELGDEAQDGGAADARAARELSHRLQPRDRVIGQQGKRGPALGRRQPRQALADGFGDGERRGVGHDLL